MKTFNQLASYQKKAAVDHELNLLLERICNGSMLFNDEVNGDDLQARIDAAFEKAERMRTPWFAREYIMDTCSEELKDIARCSAECALYPDEGEYVSRAVLP